jgi:hypothetical protein
MAARLTGSSFLLGIVGHVTRTEVNANCTKKRCAAPGRGGTSKRARRRGRGQVLSGRVALQWRRANVMPGIAIFHSGQKFAC